MSLLEELVNFALSFPCLATHSAKKPKIKKGARIVLKMKLNIKGAQTVKRRKQIFFDQLIRVNG